MGKFKKYFFLFFLVFALFTGLTAKDNWPVVKGPYLGQKPPGMKPEIFAPGIVSIKQGHEFSCTFSADGTEFYFNRGMTIMVCHRGKKGWTAPAPASFNENQRNHEPHITADNQTLFFGSMRPNPERPDMDHPYGIWRMERTENGWGPARYAGYGMYVTTTKDHTIYITDIDDKDVNKHGIACTKVVDGRFGPLERQKGGVNSPAPGRMEGRHPCIARDESFIIFDSYDKGTGGNGRLYICFRKMDGSWSAAIDLGEDINFAPIICPSISPDGKYLFFSSSGVVPGSKSDIYWVDARIIEKLKPKNFKQRS
jgi:hypothetical protein